MPKGKMRIPDRLPEFEERSLIVCLAHMHGRAFLAEGRDVSELPEIKTADTDYHYSDKEGFGWQYGGTSGGEHHNREHYERVFLNFLIGELKRLKEETGFETLYVFVPQDIKNITEEKMPKDMLKKAVFLSGNVVKENVLKIIERIDFMKE